MIRMTMFQRMFLASLGAVQRFSQRGGFTGVFHEQLRQ